MQPEHVDDANGVDNVAHERFKDGQTQLPTTWAWSIYSVYLVLKVK
jgi:hypothetical protein